MKALLPAGLVALSACLFGGKSAPKPPPPVETVETTAKRADSLFEVASKYFRAGKWNNASKALDRGMLIMSYDDPRRPLGHFMMGEILLAQENELQAVRELRRVADEGGTDSLASDALLRAGDAYAAGFLYAYTQGRDLATCGRLGGSMAAEVISHYGARPLADVRALAAGVLAAG